MNLVAEIERRLSGAAGATGLRGDWDFPDARTYVLVVFDGLGTTQLAHPAAASMVGSLVRSLDAPFPTTTTVSLATIATGLPPSQHGLLGYQLWLPDAGAVVNTIKWITLWGDPVDYDYDGFLPAPNLWERLRAAGIETLTVQPYNFGGSPMSRMLYRGCRFEPIYSEDDIVAATIDMAAQPERLIFTYVPHVDFAAHVFGQDSEQYATALKIADDIWSRLAARLPAGAVLIGTSDHGHVDFPKHRQFKIPKADHESRMFYGDSRAVFVKGEGASLAVDLPATWLSRREVIDWWGPGPRHAAFDDRVPDGILLADDDAAILHRFSDDRMTGMHGALTDAEVKVPLLLHPGSAS